MKKKTPKEKIFAIVFKIEVKFEMEKEHTNICCFKMKNL